METLRERCERHLTLPELLDALDVDYEELFDVTLEQFFIDNSERIEDLLEDYS